MVQRNPRLLLYLFPPSLPPPPPSRAPARARAFMPGISSVFSRNQYSGCTETLMYSRLTSCPNRAASWRTDESIPRNWELVFRRLVCIYIYIYVQCARGLENAILIEEYIFQTDNFSAFFRVYDVYRGWNEIQGGIILFNFHRANFRKLEIFGIYIV